MLLQGVKFASDDVIVTYTSFNRFNELSGFPNGDDNILSLTTTFVNKLNTDDGSLPVLHLFSFKTPIKYNYLIRQ